MKTRKVFGLCPIDEWADSHVSVKRQAEARVSLPLFLGLLYSSMRQDSSAGNDRFLDFSFRPRAQTFVFIFCWKNKVNAQRRLYPSVQSKVLMTAALLLRWIISAVLIKLSRHGRCAKIARQDQQEGKQCSIQRPQQSTTRIWWIFSQHIQGGKYTILLSARFTWNVIYVSEFYFQTASQTKGHGPERYERNMVAFYLNTISKNKEDSTIVAGNMCTSCILHLSKVKEFVKPSWERVDYIWLWLYLADYLWKNPVQSHQRHDIRSYPSEATTIPPASLAVFTGFNRFPVFILVLNSAFHIAPQEEVIMQSTCVQPCVIHTGAVPTLSLPHIYTHYHMVPWPPLPSQLAFGVPCRG